MFLAFRPVPKLNFWGNICKRMCKMVIFWGMYPQTSLEAGAFGIQINFSCCRHETNPLLPSSMRTLLFEVTTIH